MDLFYRSTRSKGEEELPEQQDAVAVAGQCQEDLCRLSDPAGGLDR